MYPEIDIPGFGKISKNISILNSIKFRSQLLYQSNHRRLLSTDFGIIDDDTSFINN